MAPGALHDFCFLFLPPLSPRYLVLRTTYDWLNHLARLSPQLAVRTWRCRVRFLPLPCCLLEGTWQSKRLDSGALLPSPKDIWCVRPDGLPKMPATPRNGVAIIWIGVEIVCSTAAGHCPLCCWLPVCVHCCSRASARGCSFARPNPPRWSNSPCCCPRPPPS